MYQSCVPQQKVLLGFSQDVQSSSLQWQSTLWEGQFYNRRHITVQHVLHCKSLVCILCSFFNVHKDVRFRWDFRHDSCALVLARCSLTRSFSTRLLSPDSFLSFSSFVRFNSRWIFRLHCCIPAWPDNLPLFLSSCQTLYRHSVNFLLPFEFLVNFLLLFFKYVFFWRIERLDTFSYWAGSSDAVVCCDLLGWTRDA